MNIPLPSADGDEDLSEDYTQVTKVLVGAEEQEVLVHTSFLLTIPFFRGCLQSGMIKAKTNVVCLPKTTPEHSRSLHTGCTAAKIPSQVKFNVLSDSMSGMLAVTYSVSTKLMLERLQNDVCDAILLLASEKEGLDTDFFTELALWEDLDYSPLYKFGLAILNGYLRRNGPWSRVLASSMEWKDCPLNTSIQGARFVAEAATTPTPHANRIPASGIGTTRLLNARL
jgi:hypothetical protein